MKEKVEVVSLSGELLASWIARAEWHYHSLLCTMCAGQSLLNISKSQVRDLCKNLQNKGKREANCAYDASESRIERNWTWL